MSLPVAPHRLINISEAKDALIRSLSQFHPVSKPIEDYLSQHLIPCYFRKKKLLLKEGAVCDYIYFIVKGAVRGFIKEEDKDITTWITIEGEMVTSIASLDGRGPSMDNMQAIEDTILLALSYEDLENMYEQFPESNIITRKLLQHYYSDAESRAFIARMSGADNKYRYFLQRHEPLANRIPLTYIASFLGIRNETLSKVRKRLADELKTKK